MEMACSEAEDAGVYASQSGRLAEVRLKTKMIRVDDAQRDGDQLLRQRLQVANSKSLLLDGTRR